jgi:DNA-3-methyladenine glycosylase
MKTGNSISSFSRNGRLRYDFYERDVLVVAPELVGKILNVRLQEGQVMRSMITEVEAYRGRDDLACHASRGRTARTEIMFHKGGRVYVYLVYGMYWMFNVVTGDTDDPQAVLIRGITDAAGPGKLTRLLGIDGSFYGEDLTSSARIWIEDSGFIPDVKSGKRIGIDYAGDLWKDKQWRFYM